MANKAEEGRNPGGVELSSLGQRELMTSHLIVVMRQFDAKVAEKVGFDGNIFEEVSQSLSMDRDPLSPLANYMRGNGDKYMYIDNKAGEDKFVYRISFNPQEVRMDTGGIGVQFKLDEKGGLVSLESETRSGKFKVDFGRRFPIRLTRGFDNSYASADYHNIDRAGNFEMAEGGTIRAAFQFGSTVEKTSVVYSLKDDKIIDWQGLGPIIDVERDKNRLTIRDDYDSKPYVLPLRGNIFNELALV